MNTEKLDFDSWSDELDVNSLNQKGIAILKRRYIKGTDYLTSWDNSIIIAKGITAFLFSNSYSGGLQLPPINFNGKLGAIDTIKYFQQYYEICKKFYLLNENSKPNSVHKKLEKEFLLRHIKQEQQFFKELKAYLECIVDKEERLLKEQYVLSYLKWIKNKQNPLKTIDYLEIGFWIFLFLAICFLIVFEFCFIEKEWNFIQILINKRFLKSDELQKQITVYLILALIGSVSLGFVRIKKIFKTHA